jgi:hypothetical protein
MFTLNSNDRHNDASSCSALTGVERKSSRKSTQSHHKGMSQFALKNFRVTRLMSFRVLAIALALTFCVCEAMKEEYSNNDVIDDSVPKKKGFWNFKANKDQTNHKGGWGTVKFFLCSFWFWTSIVVAVAVAVAFFCPGEVCQNVFDDTGASFWMRLAVIVPGMMLLAGTIGFGATRLRKMQTLDPNDYEKWVSGGQNYTVGLSSSKYYRHKVLSFSALWAITLIILAFVLVFVGVAESGVELGNGEKHLFQKMNFLVSFIGLFAVGLGTGIVIAKEAFKLHEQPLVDEAESTATGNAEKMHPVKTLLSNDVSNMPDRESQSLQDRDTSLGQDLKEEERESPPVPVSINDGETNGRQDSIDKGHDAMRSRRRLASLERMLDASL